MVFIITFYLSWSFNIFNCKKTESMAIIKRKSPRYELQFGSNTTMQIQKFKYLYVLTEDGKCNTEMWTCIGLAKETFQKLRKEFWIASWYSSIHMTDNSPCMKKLEVAEMWFGRRILKIPLMEQVIKNEVLKNIYIQNQEKAAEILWACMKKKSFENLTLRTYRAYWGQDRIKEKDTDLMCLYKWIAEWCA